MQRDTEAAWALWTQFLHSRIGFTPQPNGPARPSSPVIQKLQPQIFQYNLFVEEKVPGGTSPTNAVRGQAPSRPHDHFCSASALGGRGPSAEEEGRCRPPAVHC